MPVSNIFPGIKVCGFALPRKISRLNSTQIFIRYSKCVHNNKTDINFDELG